MGRLTSSTGDRRAHRMPVARAGLSAISMLGASAMLMIGAGLGTAAALTASPAGASTSHSSLPPVNVSVSNTPTVNVGNTPTVNIGNTPTVNVAKPVSQPQFFYTGVYSNNNQQTAVNVGGSGKIIAFEVTSGNGESIQFWLVVNGQVAWYQDTNGGCCWVNTPAFGWVPNDTYGGGNRAMYYAPPGGVPFHSSFQIVVNAPSGGGGIGVRGIYTIDQ